MAETASDSGISGTGSKGGIVKRLRQKFSGLSKTKKILCIIGLILLISIIVIACALLIIWLVKRRGGGGESGTGLLSDIGPKSNAVANTDSQLSPSRSPAGVKVANVSFLSDNTAKKESSLAKKKKSSLVKPGSSGLKVDSSMRIQNMLGVKDVRLVNGKSSNLVDSSIQ